MECFRVCSLSLPVLRLSMHRSRQYIGHHTPPQSSVFPPSFLFATDKQTLFRVASALMYLLLLSKKRDADIVVSIPFLQPC